MSPSRLYTIPELAEITGRSEDFWDRQIKAKLLQCLQPTGKNGTRFVTKELYDAWFQASLAGARPESHVAPTYRRRPTPRPSWVQALVNNR
jgi:hypothetical protein